MQTFCGRIRNVYEDERIFEILYKKRIYHFRLTRSQMKKFEAYLQDGLYVFFKAFDEAKNTVTRKVTLSHTENTAGTLKATNVESLGDVTGFATVTLLNVNDAGDFKRVDENGNKYLLR